MFKFDSLNVIGFDEAPAGDGTACVGKVLGIEFFLFVKTGSADHKNIYKTILSKAPLEGAEEHELTVWLESRYGSYSDHQDQGCFVCIFLFAYQAVGRKGRSRP